MSRGTFWGGSRAALGLGLLGLGLLGLGLLGLACSGTREPLGGGAGTGGTSMTGAGGARDAGVGGSAAICDKGGGATPVGGPCVDTKSKGGCNHDEDAGSVDDAPCWNTCGPIKSGTKNCTCVNNMWVCPTCAFDISDPRKYDCYKTAGAIACPPDPTDTSGMMLPASGGACTQAPCQPCGSASATSYRDSTGTPKMGWCVCVPKSDGTGSVYSCASIVEWAPQCQ